MGVSGEVRGSANISSSSIGADLVLTPGYKCGPQHFGVPKYKLIPASPNKLCHTHLYGQALKTLSI